MIYTRPVFSVTCGYISPDNTVKTHFNCFQAVNAESVMAEAQEYFLSLHPYCNHFIFTEPVEVFGDFIPFYMRPVTTSEVL